MLRKITIVVGLTLSLLVVRDAAAIPVTPTDLGTLTLGTLLPLSTVDNFVRPPNSPGADLGTLANEVWFNEDDALYTYVHTVTPTLANNFLFNTQFEVVGFNGVAGFSFADTGALPGGTGTAADFAVSNLSGQLNWRTVFGDEGGWDAGQAIRFFFVSTAPPGTGDYNLSSTAVGTGQSAAPVAAPIPEPGSIALLGSGLVGLYTAMRRRRSLRA